MGLFNKNAKSKKINKKTKDKKINKKTTHENSEVVDVDKKVSTPKHAARNKKNELVKVLDESVWESVREELKNNSQFVITDDNGNTRYVAFLFDTRQCGGLAGRDARKDESKGSIIEAIRTGAIKTYIRLEMLMDETFVIIPDIETIDAMDEFGILADGEYILCTISDDGNDIKAVTDGDDEVVVTFDQIRSTIQNNLDVHTLFPGGGNTVDAMLGMSPDKKNNEIKAEASVGEVLDGDIEDIPDDDIEDLPDDLDDIPDDVTPQPVPVQEASKPSAPAPVPVAETSASKPVADDFDDDLSDIEDVSDNKVDENSTDDTDGDGGYDEFEDITEEVVKEYVTRRFYSDDLGLEVSTEPFDMQFMHGNAYVPFNENRGTGLLNEYISNLAKDANVRMRRMHNENLFRMREKYMQLIQQQCINIAAALDVSDDKTQYGMIRFGIEQNREENLEGVNAAVEEKKKQLNESWNRKLDQVAAEAATSAKSQYEDRYGRSHESDLQNLVSREKDEIERDYQSSLRRMNEDRKAEASKLLDIAVNETLGEMADLYIKVLHDEQREQARLQKEITKFIDDNRKDEKARIETLAEERRQTKKAEEVRREYATKIKAMAAEFDMKKTVLQADVDRMRQEHDIELGKIEANWTKKLSEEKSHSDDLQKKLDDLLEKFASVDETKALEYKKRMEALEHEKETWKRHTDDIIAEHKKADHSNFKMSLIVIIAAVIAAIGIGFMFGSIVNIRKSSDIERSRITQMHETDSSNIPAKNNVNAGDRSN